MSKVLAVRIIWAGGCCDILYFISFLHIEGLPLLTLPMQSAEDVEIGDARSFSETFAAVVAPDSLRPGREASKKVLRILCGSRLGRHARGLLMIRAWLLCTYILCGMFTPETTLESS